MWNEKVNKVLTREGFSRTKADPGLYSRNQQDRWIYILINIDDIITCFEQEGDYNQLGNISYYLGIQIEREQDGSSLLNQSQKISDILEEFHMQDAKEVKTPMEPG